MHVWNIMLKRIIQDVKQNNHKKCAYLQLHAFKQRKRQLTSDTRDPGFKYPKRFRLEFSFQFLYFINLIASNKFILIQNGTFTRTFLFHRVRRKTLCRKVCFNIDEILLLQCDQIGRFIALWATFQRLLQQLFYPNYPLLRQFL